MAVFTQIRRFFKEAGKYKPEKKEDEKEDCGCDKADRKHLKKDSEDPAYKYSESAQGKRVSFKNDLKIGWFRFSRSQKKNEKNIDKFLANQITPFINFEFGGKNGLKWKLIIQWFKFTDFKTVLRF